MKKQKIFITGAGSGLGKMVALSLARRGHTVYASVQYENQINSITAIAQEENLDLICIKLDILLEADRQLILDYDIDVFIKKEDIIIWNILEQKSFNSIIRKYIKAVETKFPKKRYTAPWWQALGIQIGRIFGM